MRYTPEVNNVLWGFIHEMQVLEQGIVVIAYFGIDGINAITYPAKRIAYHHSCDILILLF